MTKQEKIKEFVEFCSDLAISNDSVSEEDVLNFINSIQSEENNGWTKIESEADLPKGSVFCHFIVKGFEELDFQGLFDGNFWNEDQLYTWEIVTHYQPIEKPKPPLY